MTEKLSPGRAQIKKDFQSVSIEIPAKKYWLSIILIPLWLVGMFFTAKSYFPIMFQKDSPLFNKLFFAVWLIFAVIIILLAIATLFWQLFGKEIIRIGKTKLCIRKNILGMGLKKKYEVNKIKNFDIHPVDYSKNKYLKYYSYINNKNGKLKFDYGMKTIKFANDIDEAEARKLLELFKSNPHFRREIFLQTNDHF